MRVSQTQYFKVFAESSESRAMCHDENLYPNPDRFDPDRFMLNGKLNSEVFAPEDIVFGFGRR